MALRSVPAVAFRRLVKQLTCPQCGDVVADADYRPFPSTLVLHATDGTLIQPTSGAVLVRLAQRQLADPGDPGHAQAEARLEFLRKNLGELMYDLRCRRGHVTLATTPGIVRAMRRTPGRWVAPH
jgi:hypothetical protein